MSIMLVCILDTFTIRKINTMNRLFTLCIAAVIMIFFSEGFAQSKKELKAQLDELTQKNIQEKKASDSLLNVKDKQIAELQKQVKSQADSITAKNRKIEQKQQELESYMSATSRMGGRVRMKEPDLSKIQSTIPATISLKLLVDENGNVVEAINDSKRTTTTDKMIIEKVIELVKKDLRYSREPGASLLQANFTVKIGPKN